MKYQKRWSSKTENSKTKEYEMLFKLRLIVIVKAAATFESYSGSRSKIFCNENLLI